MIGARIFPEFSQSNINIIIFQVRFFLINQIEKQFDFQARYEIK